MGAVKIVVHSLSAGSPLDLKALLPRFRTRPPDHDAGHTHHEKGQPENGTHLHPGPSHKEIEVQFLKEPEKATPMGVGSQDLAGVLVVVYILPTHDPAILVPSSDADQVGPACFIQAPEPKYRVLRKAVSDLGNHGVQGGASRLRLDGKDSRFDQRFDLILEDQNATGSPHDYGPKSNG